MKYLSVHHHQSSFYAVLSRQWRWSDIFRFRCPNFHLMQLKAFSLLLCVFVCSLGALSFSFVKLHCRFHRIVFSALNACPNHCSDLPFLMMLNFKLLTEVRLNPKLHKTGVCNRRPVGDNLARQAI